MAYPPEWEQSPDLRTDIHDDTARRKGNRGPHDHRPEVVPEAGIPDQHRKPWNQLRGGR